MKSSPVMGAFRGCFTFLGVFALMAALFATIAYIRFPTSDPESRRLAIAFTGVGSGLFVTFAIFFFWEVTRRAREATMLRASESVVPPADGAKIAACGVLVADGPLLEAPLSGTRAAIYKYDIVVALQKSSSTVCSGYGLTPSHIDTPAGRVRLLGYVDPAFRPTSLRGPEVRARAEAYLAATRITPLGTAAAREYLGTLVDDDGAIRSDTGQRPDDLADSRLSFLEHAVADGEPVCAFGRYSAERGGLVPDPASVDPYPIRLRRGDGAAVRLALLKSAIGYSFGAVAMVGIAIGIALIAHLMVAP